MKALKVRPALTTKTRVDLRIRAMEMALRGGCMAGSLEDTLAFARRIEDWLRTGLVLPPPMGKRP